MGRRAPRGLTAGLLACALACLGPSAAAKDEPAAAWKGIKVREGAHSALVDARSLVIVHEHRVAPGALVKLGKTQLTFALDGSGKPNVRVKAPGAAKPGAPKPLKAEPSLFKLGAYDLKYGLSVRVAPTRDALWIASAYGVELPVEREKAYLVDSDLDGVLGSAGDGYVAPGSRTVAPWHGNVWTREAGLAVRRREDGAWEATALPVPYPDHKDHTAAWRLLQWRRQQCGVLPLGYKPELEKGIRLHGEYCIQNDYRGHDQDPAKKAYSKEGAVAGAQSVLGYGIRTFVDGIEQQLATLYHRNGLLQPALTHTAMAIHKGVFGANVRDSASGPLGDVLIVVPPHGCQDVPREFSPGGEIPMPVANRQVGLAQLGTSVGAFARSLEQASSLSARPSLRVTRLIGAKKKPGPSFRLDLYFPGNTPNPAVHRSNFGNVALTPPRPLEPNTTYRCTIRIPLPPGTRTSMPSADPFEYVWEFTTAR